MPGPGLMPPRPGLVVSTLATGCLFNFDSSLSIEKI
jgi:hypothetical protein